MVVLLSALSHKLQGKIFFFVICKFFLNFILNLLCANSQKSPLCRGQKNMYRGQEYKWCTRNCNGSLETQPMEKNEQQGSSWKEWLRPCSNMLKCSSCSPLWMLVFLCSYNTQQLSSTTHNKPPPQKNVLHPWQIQRAGDLQLFLTQVFTSIFGFMVKC